jgi:hypothetical protein
MATSSKKTGPKDLKKKGSPPKRSLQEIFEREAGSLSTPSRGTGATGEPAAEISAKVGLNR